MEIGRLSPDLLPAVIVLTLIRRLSSNLRRQ
jgi:hypothetical protein